MPPFFFRPDEKIDTEVYYKVLRYTVLPWLKKLPHRNYVWQQMVHHLIWRQEPKVLQGQYGPFLAEEILATVIPGSKSAGFFLATIIKEWDNYPEKHIINACKRFRPCLEAVVKANGGHIE
ncbi:Uncharacterized protein FKW44_020552 [Caligus rogercresseyi]|uniref:Uncharacterized protein n=1 Tax=Caligus rogercresseyi TaxID=217165 RepID=A0A7T8JY71_CALRO|nr:Uncharacterized protein FKW44_020552 [Caligus rogercresseyi]